MRSPPPGPRLLSLIRVPVSAPAGIVISRRFPSTSTRRVVPWYASLEADLRLGFVGRSPGRVGERGAAAGPVARPSRPIPLRMSSKPRPPVGRDPRPPVDGEPPAAPIASSPKNIRKKSLNSPASCWCGTRSGRCHRGSRRSRRRRRRVSSRRPRAGLAGPADGLPVGPELVVLLALGRVAQDLVRLVDLLEPALGGGVAWFGVRMMLPGELAEGLLDLSLGRGLGHAQDRVVVLVFETRRPGSAACH